MAEGDLFSVGFIVPGAARGKGSPRSTIIAGRSAIYTDTKTRNEIAVVRAFANIAMEGRVPFDGAVVLRLCAYRAIPTSFSREKHEAAERGEIVPVTKPDIDNFTKLAADAMNGIVFADDRQIVSLIADKKYSAQPRLVLDVRSR
jgi:Holliday junction resolvase RusA-like endonuclease